MIIRVVCNGKQHRCRSWWAVVKWMSRWLLTIRNRRFRTTPRMSFKVTWSVQRRLSMWHSPTNETSLIESPTNNRRFIVHWADLTIYMLGNFSCFLSSDDFFLLKIILNFEKFFQEPTYEEKMRVPPPPPPPTHTHTLGLFPLWMENNTTDLSCE